MGKVQSAYDVLRLPYDAPSSQVRSRYRQLLRRHQPDLERQDLFQDEACLHLVRSYLVVESPGRVEYTRLVRASRGAPVAVFVLLPGLVCFWVGVVFMGTPPADHGAFRHYLTWPADFVYRLPAGVSLEEGLQRLIEWRDSSDVRMALAAKS